MTPIAVASAAWLAVLIALVLTGRLIVRDRRRVRPEPPPGDRYLAGSTVVTCDPTGHAVITFPMSLIPVAVVAKADDMSVTVDGCGPGYGLPADDFTFTVTDRHGIPPTRPVRIDWLAVGFPIPDSRPRSDVEVPA